MISAGKNKILFSIAVAISIIVFFSLINAGQVFHLWQLGFSNNLYGKLEPSKDIVLVAIDDKTINALGTPDTWSRSYYAQVLNNISKYDPKVVAFDVVFLNERDSEGDDEFVEALKEAKQVVIGMLRVVNENAASEQKYSGTIRKSLDKFLNIKSVTDGVLSSLADEDNAVRKDYIAVYDDEGNTYNSFINSVIEALPENDLSLKAKSVMGTESSVNINYFSVPNKKSYLRLPFIDVYTENYIAFDPVNLKDKIILVGAFSDILKDSFFTPVDANQPMPGVEIHANAVQTILDGKFLRNMSTTEQIIFFILLSMISVAIFVFTRIRWSLLYLVMFFGGYTLMAPLMFSNGVIVDLVHPYMIVLTAFVASYIYRYFTEFREKIELKGAFSKYVSPDVVKQIILNPGKLMLGGQNRNISVLFTDIAHFTSISEKLKPESLVALLNEYFDAMGEVIKEEGGTLDKYEGDAIMAFFGAPLEVPDHAKKACMTALKMRLRLDELLKSWKENPLLPGGEQKPVIDFRCGVNTGDVIVGNIGAKDRFNYTAMGDSVNLASRLEGANKQYGTNLMISEFTLAQIGDEFIVRELDLIKVVGKDKPVRVYELLGLTADLAQDAEVLLRLYNKGIELYHGRKFEEAMHQFEEVLKSFPGDGPSKLYKQRCEILRNFPPAEDWDGVFEMRSK